MLVPERPAALCALREMTPPKGESGTMRAMFFWPRLAPYEITRLTSVSGKKPME